MVASQYDSTPCSNFIYRAIDGCLDVSKAGKTSRQTTSQNHHFDSIYAEWCCIQNHLSFLTENRSMFLLGNERFHFLNLDVVQFTLQLAVGPLQLVVLGQSLFQFTVERPTPKIDLNYRNSSNKKQTVRLFLLFGVFALSSPSTLYSSHLPCFFSILRKEIMFFIVDVVCTKLCLLRRRIFSDDPLVQL